MSAQAQSTAKTLVEVASPATPLRSLDIGFGVSLSSVDLAGRLLYDYLVAYEEDPLTRKPPGVLREDTSIHAGKPSNMALTWR
ncbi:hypothetical protein ACTMU2_20000 [Cupriavidus basilensis]